MSELYDTGEGPLSHLWFWPSPLVCHSQTLVSEANKLAKALGNMLYKPVCHLGFYNVHKLTCVLASQNNCAIILSFSECLMYWSLAYCMYLFYRVFDIHKLFVHFGS